MLPSLELLERRKLLEPLAGDWPGDPPTPSIEAFTRNWTRGFHLSLSGFMAFSSDGPLGKRKMVFTLSDGAGGTSAKRAVFVDVVAASE